MSALCESFVPVDLPFVPTTATYLFGYGSLIWRPGFTHLSAHPCYITGLVRRFYQSSTDHRGTESQPGRVVTLVPTSEEQLNDIAITADNNRTYGMIYLVDRFDVSAVIDYLTIREQGGYILCKVECYLLDDRSPPRSVSGLTYIGTPSNPHWVGPAPLSHIAQQIIISSGPSGTNIEYLQKLHHWLKSINREDPHVTQLMRHVKQLQQLKEQQQRQPSDHMMMMIYKEEKEEKSNSNERFLRAIR